MTIVERIRKYPVLAYAEHGRILDQMLPYFSDAPCVDMTNIMQYLRRETEAGHRVSTDRFPGAIPPWKKFILFWNGAEQDAAYYCIHRAPSDNNESAVIGEALNKLHPTADSWMHALVFVHDSHRGEYPNYAEFVMRLMYPYSGTEVIPDIQQIIDEPTYANKEETFAYCKLSALCIMAACSFANSKNVHIRPVPVSRQVRRHSERTGEPIHEHHVIEIHPVQQATRNDTESRESGGDMPLHLCRGHFARYGGQYGTKKLFGKIEGQFWIPQHVRGTLDKGLVTKDYAVMA